MNAQAKVLPLAGKRVIPCTPAEQVWIGDMAEQLMLGADVKFKCRLYSEQAVTQERFHVGLDELLMERLGRSGASQSALGKMAHGIQIGDLSMARDGLSEAMGVPNRENAMLEVAEGLLRPLAADGLIAQAEDGEL